MRRIPASSTAIAAALILLSACTCSADGGVVLTPDHESYLLGPHVEILHDPHSKATIEDVSSPPLSNGFARSRQKVLNFAFAQGAHWLRFTLVNERNENRSWVLESKSPTVDHVDLYFDSGRGKFVKKSSGDAIPFKQWEIPYVFPAFRLDIPPGEKLTCYMRLESSGMIRVPLFLWPDRAFEHYARQEQARSALFFGAVAIIVLYSLLYWGAVRDTTHLYYLLWTASFGMTILILAGWAYQYLWPSLPRWNSLALGVFVGLMHFSFMGFGRHFVKSKEYAPCLDKVAWATMYAPVLFWPLVFVAYRLGIMLALAATLTITVLAFILPLRIYLKGYKPALGFFVAYLPLLCGLVYWTIDLVGVAPYGGVLSHPIRIGMLATLTLLSGVLARRYSALPREYNESLESEVASRTRELNNALTELKKRRDELELTVQERTEAQQQLEKTLIIQKAILDNIADMAWLKDREGRFLAVNAAFESASGINRDQLVGRTDFDFWPQELAQRFRADDEEVMKSCEPKRIEETRARETSKPTWIETIKSPICDADGTVIGITGISRNITKYVEEIAETTAAKERIETELFIASEIQKRMLPPEEPEFALEKESQLCAKYRPAREVGGDLCDYFLAGDHNLCFLVGDVSEKGVAAALFMALTIALIRISAKQGYLPDQVLRMVNAELAQGSTMCMFVTLFIGSIDLRTGELVYSNAGHNPPYLLPATGGCRELKIPRGKPLGLPGKAEFQLAKTTLTPGDGLFLFTDGITEAVDVSGELFSEIRLEDILDRMPGLRAKEIVDGVFRRLEDFSEGVAQADDITALCVRFRSSVQPSERTSVTLTGDLSQIYVAGEALERFARDHSIAEDVLGDMWLALEEVVVNIINHGIESPSGRIEVLFEIDRTTLTITVIDDCRPFNPLDVEPFEKDKYWNEKLIGGLGLHLVRNLTDSLEYHRKDDKNVLILKKGLAQNIPTP